MTESHSPETNAERILKRVSSEGTAHVMAYAQKGLVERAISAVKSGRLDEATNSFKQAEQAANVAKYGIENQDTPELVRIAEAACQELAYKYGVKPEDFSLVGFNRGDHPVHVVVYAAPNGLNLGDDGYYDEKRSLDDVMSKKNKRAHRVKIDGVIYDDRAGMTLDTYQALVETKRQAGEELPDSEAVIMLDREVHTCTVLSGGEADSYSGQYAYVDRGLVKTEWTYREAGGRGIRFRPAVILGL